MKLTTIPRRAILRLLIMAEMHGPDEDCDACYECPGCGGGDGSTPKRARIEERPGIVMLVCDDCNGAGVLCPWYDPDLPAKEVSERG